jgi:lysozyme
VPPLWQTTGKVTGGSSAPAAASGDVPMMGIKLIKEFEGCHLSAYPDPLSGNLPITIGWGSTRKKDGSPFKMGDKITQAEADELLISQCQKQFIPALQKIPYWNEMSDGKRGALLSFAYNLGAGFYGGADFNTITKRLKNKEWDQVPDALYLYRNPGSNVEAGLARRRKAEGEAWKKG